MRCVCECVSECVCVWERERERDGERENKRRTVDSLEVECTALGCDVAREQRGVHTEGC